VEAEERGRRNGCGGDAAQATGQGEGKVLMSHQLRIAFRALPVAAALLGAVLTVRAVQVGAQSGTSALVSSSTVGPPARQAALSLAPHDSDVNSLIRSRPELAGLMTEAEHLAAEWIAPAEGFHWSRPPVASEQMLLEVSSSRPATILAAQMDRLTADPRWTRLMLKSHGAIVFSAKSVKR